jgi:hypothetical protein
MDPILDAGDIISEKIRLQIRLILVKYWNKQKKMPCIYEEALEQ